MRRLVVLGVVCALAAGVGAAFAWWWLVLQETASIDTLRQGPSSEVPMPTDGTPVAQSFAVPPGGTDRVCVWLHNQQSTDTQVLVQLHADRDRVPGPLLSRDVRLVPAKARSCLDATLARHGASALGRWWLSLRAVRPQAMGSLNVIVTDVPVLADDRLLIGSTEKWGTLGMKVGAPESTRWHVAWPREIFRPSRRQGLVVLLGVGAFTAAGVLLLAAAGLASSAASARCAALLVPLGLLVLHGTTHLEPPARAITYTGAGRPLLDELRVAQMQTTAPSLGEGFALLTSDIRQPGDRALFALPESSVTWAVSVAEPTSLDTAVALRQEAWTRPGDGATFSITASVDGRTDLLWQRHVDPYFDPGARRWVDVTVRLDRYVGREIGLTLRTTAGPTGNAVMDAAMWREPVLRRSVIR